MSLRYRLFLWVSGLFVFLATCSFFLENYVSKKELGHAQQMVRAKILDMSEHQRMDMQKFLAESIAENAVRIDAVLNNISTFAPMALRFAPTQSNERKGTWGEASDLLVEHKWIDFLQNTSEGKVTSAIVPQKNALSSVFRIAINENLCWVYDPSYNYAPQLGVRIPYSLTTNAAPSSTDEILQQVQGVVPEVFLLFDLEKMRSNLTGNEPIFAKDPQTLSPVKINWTGGYELDVAEFVRAFQSARQQILAQQLQPPYVSKEHIQKQMQEAGTRDEGIVFSLPSNPLLSSGFSPALMKEKLEDAALRYTQVNVIWLLVALYDSGVFGSDLFAYPAPLSTTVFSSNNEIGFAVETDKVLFGNKIFEDGAYYKNNTPAKTHANLATSLAIIESPTSDHVFLGNTAQISIYAMNRERKGFLTLGVDVDTLLQRLSLAIHQSAVLVHNTKPLSGYTDNADKIGLPILKSLPFEQMLKEKMGVISWNGQNFFYIHVMPFEQLDLHFFLFNPEEKQFALLKDLQQGAQHVVSTILFNLHIAGLVALLIAIFIVNNISRRITKPIIQLANATKDVAEGNLEIVIPPMKHRDEIATLCRSFEEMVTGLKEKEKVKGVLNKVVSPEIALEILKGNVHLGGEEKKVTVLFADIRNFTQMTQHMQPTDVIELLNTCMTKVSLAIDQNSGVIDKYVGDEAMALFGAPIAHEDDALNAIKSAVEILDIMRAWNKERAEKSQAPIELGIGIHTGNVLVGNMGAENRLNYTVIGSHVNLSARLCSVAKGMEILITKDTLEEPLVKESIVYEQRSAITLKGFDLPIDVYSVQGLKG